jgi:hypothetical protein
MPQIMTMKDKLIAAAGAVTTVGFFATALASLEISKANNYNNDDQLMHETSTMYLVGLIGTVTTPIVTLLTLYCLAKRAATEEVNASLIDAENNEIPALNL